MAALMKGDVKMRLWLVLTITMFGLLALGLTLGSLPFLGS